MSTCTVYVSLSRAGRGNAPTGERRTVAVEIPDRSERSWAAAREQAIAQYAREERCSPDAVYFWGSW